MPSVRLGLAGGAGKWEESGVLMAKADGGLLTLLLNRSPVNFLGIGLPPPEKADGPASEPRRWLEPPL